MLRRRARPVTLAAAADAAEEDGGGYGTGSAGPGPRGGGSEVAMVGPLPELVSRGETERDSSPEDWGDGGGASLAGRELAEG